MQQQPVAATINYAEVGEAISHELAAKMVKDYHDVSGQILSFNIGKNILDQILAQPGCVGLKIFNAMDNGKPTLVYTGLNSKGEVIVEYPAVGNDGKLRVFEAMIGDRTQVETPTWMW